MVKMLWISKIHYLSQPHLSDSIGGNSEFYIEMSQKPQNFCVWHEIGSWLCSPVKAVATSPTSNVSQCVAFWCSVLILAVVSEFFWELVLTVYVCHHCEIVGLCCSQLFAI